jgi:hypothetical protein
MSDLSEADLRTLFKAPDFDEEGADLRAEFAGDAELWFSASAEGVVVGISQGKSKLSVRLDPGQAAEFHRAFEPYGNTAGALAREIEKRELVMARLMAREMGEAEGERRWARTVVDLALAVTMPMGQERQDFLGRLAPIVADARSALERKPPA